jgi:hypothetical protein
LSLEQRIDLYNKSNDPSFKGTFFRSLTGILYTNQQNFNGTLFLICKEKYLTIPVVIYCRKDFFLLQRLNIKIGQLLAAGLIDHWHSSILDQRFLHKIESKQPKKIALEHLMGGIILWIVGCLIATITFACEILYFKMCAQ